MKVVIAMDSFKGSMSSMAAGHAAREGILRVCDAKVVVKPLADGGEGTTQALVEGLGGRYVQTVATGPLGRPVTARYGILADGHTAVLEMAEAAGLTLVREEERDPTRATTRGVGEMILDAIGRGCRDFIVGIGGSATSDGGVGMRGGKPYGRAWRAWATWRRFVQSGWRRSWKNAVFGWPVT